MAAWGFAAILFGSVALASMRFASPIPATAGPSASVSSTTGITLPGPGDVTTTGSVVTNGELIHYGVYPSQKAQSNREIESEFATLRAEVVSLRRRISMIAEQNRIYSDRLAAIEQGDLTGTGRNSSTASMTNRTSRGNIALGNGLTEPDRMTAPPPAYKTPNVTKETPASTRQLSASQSTEQQGHAPLTPLDLIGRVNPPETSGSSRVPVPAKPQVETLPAPEAGAESSRPVGSVSSVRRIPINNTDLAQTTSVQSIDQGSSQSESKPDLPQRELSQAAEATVTVRLPVEEKTTDPVTTASIPPEPKGSSAATSRPSPYVLDQQMLMPSHPAGTIRSMSQMPIGRTEFAIELGRFATPDLAAQAWQDLRSRHSSDELQGMTPLIDASSLSSGETRLLLGPFANAADAAISCLRLAVDKKTTCQPAVYIGKRLSPSQKTPSQDGKLSAR